MLMYSTVVVIFSKYSAAFYFKEEIIDISLIKGKR